MFEKMRLNSNFCYKLTQTLFLNYMYLIFSRKDKDMINCEDPIVMLVFVIFLWIKPYKIIYLQIIMKNEEILAAYDNK